MNDFDIDDAFQREKRERFLLPWYAMFSSPTLVDYDEEFRDLGIDTILVRSDNRHVINVEEKIVRWPGYEYDAFALETHSCTIPGKESPGWMVYGAACRLNYCFEQQSGALKCYWINFVQLKNWFWPREKEFPVFQMAERNRTKGRVVPIRLVEDAVQVQVFELGKR